MSEAGDNSTIVTVPYFLVLLKPGANHDDGPQHFAAHVAFIERMTAANVVLLGGDFEAAVENAEAAYLLHTASLAEAEAWAAQDPLIAHGVYVPRIVAWKLVGIAASAIDPTLTS